MNYIKFIGLDVHKETITVAVAHREGGEAEFLGTIPNTMEAISKLVKRLGEPSQLRFCYEAGPCGYGIYRQLLSLGTTCIVVAPSLVPVKPSDKIKTDRRDAMKLARSLRNGDLTPVWVPDQHQEALRDLLRAREDACEDLLRKRNQLSKYLLRHDLTYPGKTRAWGVKHRRWLESIKFETTAQQIVYAEYLHAIDEVQSRVERLELEITNLVEKLVDKKVIQALQALRGVGLITAAVLVAELGDITRFKKAEQLMSYAGIVPKEYSSGEKRRTGRITKTGNPHVRYVVIESSWHYRHKPCVGERLKKRNEVVSPGVKAIAWKAQIRLHQKYIKLVTRGKSKQVAAVAVGRELLGFIWAIAQEVAKENIETKVA